jgi:uncharacterized membrane protein YhiD involved in acid resistance
MKEKKNSADWYIAATHWLTATIGMAIFGAVIGIILALISQNPTIIMVGIIILYPLMMWLAVKYSARYLDKTYVIKNTNQIVILSTIYIVIVGGGYRVMNLLSKGILTADHIGFAIAIIVFYFASKKYIKNNVGQEFPAQTV